MLVTLSAPNNAATPGDGGWPGICSAAPACVRMRVNTGRDCTSDSVCAFSSRGAVRKAVLICSKNDVEICRLRELLDEREIIVELGLDGGQIVRRDEKQRLGSQHRKVLLVKNVEEQVGLRRHFHGKPFDKLPVFLHVPALHDHGEFVALMRELLLKREKILVILQVRPHEVVLVHVELQERDGDGDARQEQRQLRPDKPARMTAYRRGQPRQQPRQQ